MHIQFIYRINTTEQVMNANQRNSPQSASVQCNIEIELQIEVAIPESISNERLHADRLKIQRHVDYANAAMTPCAA